MITKTIDKSAKPEQTVVSRRAARQSIAPTPIKAVVSALQRQNSEPERATKQAKLLQHLTGRDGASIEDLMQATAWQQHSVRGFLAGTVKKKMGLALTSSKADGEARRYRIAKRRGR